MRLIKDETIKTSFNELPEIFRNYYDHIENLFNSKDYLTNKKIPIFQIEAMIEYMIELLEKEEKEENSVIAFPKVLTDELEQHINDYNESEDPRIKKLIKMRRNQKYKRHINLLNFILWAVIFIKEYYEKIYENGYIERLNDYGYQLSHSAVPPTLHNVFTAFTSVLIPMVTFYVIKKNGYTINEKGILAEIYKYISYVAVRFFSNMLENRININLFRKHMEEVNGGVSTYSKSKNSADYNIKYNMEQMPIEFKRYYAYINTITHDNFVKTGIMPLYQMELALDYVIRLIEKTKGEKEILSVLPFEQIADVENDIESYKNDKTDENQYRMIDPINTIYEKLISMRADKSYNNQYYLICYAMTIAYEIYKYKRNLNNAFRGTKIDKIIEFYNQAEHYIVPEKYIAFLTVLAYITARIYTDYKPLAYIITIFSGYSFVEINRRYSMYLFKNYIEHTKPPEPPKDDEPPEPPETPKDDEPPEPSETPKEDEPPETPKEDEVDGGYFRNSGDFRNITNIIIVVVILLLVIIIFLIYIAHNYTYPNTQVNACFQW